MCRDDKYLYWRVDFQSINPLAKPPAGTKDGIQATIIIPSGPGQHLDMSVYYDKLQKTYRTWYGIANDSGGKFVSIGTDKDIVYKMADGMFVARLEFSKMAKYLNAPLRTRIAVASPNKGQWNGEMSSLVSLIDFSK
jgi:hypothetical protein